MKDNTYELAKQLIDIVREQSKTQDIQGSICYPWIAGVLEATIKMVPETKENISYLKEQIRLAKMG